MLYSLKSPGMYLLQITSMPKFTAPAALTLLKEKQLDLLFIIIASGSSGEDIAVAAMKAGAHDYIDLILVG